MKYQKILNASNVNLIWDEVENRLIYMIKINKEIYKNKTFDKIEREFVENKWTIKQSHLVDHSKFRIQ